MINESHDYNEADGHANSDGYNWRHVWGLPIGKRGYFGENLSNPVLQRFLADLALLAQQEPETGSLPLRVGGRPCGYVSPRAAHALSHQWPQLIVDSVLDLPLDDGLTEKLLDMSKVLLHAGCISKWRDELLDVWCDNNAVGAVERGAVRSLGLLTRAVHLNAWSASGDLWVARRALDKATDPGMWDTLVGGLVGHGEPDELALERESAEEAGLEADQIKRREPLRSVYRMRRRVPEGFQYEEVLTSDCVLADGITPENQDGEVMQIACLPLKEVQAMLLDGQFTLEASIVIAQSLVARQ